MKIETAVENLKVLDVCHQQIQLHLAKLAKLLAKMDDDQDDSECRQQAALIEAFFSSTSRHHHADEEKFVFPSLLTSEDAELVQAVLTLQQDHGWIEQNWIELAPLLRSIATAGNCIDVAEFRHYVEVFLELCNAHIALEETLIYPEYKSRLAKEMTSRINRTAVK
jgi:hemerythrin-like domain-containing protein